MTASAAAAARAEGGPPGAAPPKQPPPGQPSPAHAAPGQPSPGQAAPNQASGQPVSDEDALSHGDLEPETEGAQEARAAQRELVAHAPAFFLGDDARFGGSAVGGSQHGVSGGQVGGDVYMGGRTEIHHHGTPGAAPDASGEVPRPYVEELAAVYAEGPAFAAALERLREERVLVLSGAHATGRNAAALMLVHRLGVPAVHALSPETPPAALSGHLTRPAGYVLRDLPLSRNRPLRDTHLFAARDQLVKTGGHLVVTVENSPHLPGVTPYPWSPPPAEDVVRALLDRHRPGEADALLALGPVLDFLAGAGRHPAEAAAFAQALAEYDGTAQALARLADFGQAAVEKQCRDWLGDPETGLRDKAFLLALAVFDQAPYVLAAELADKLFVHFERLQHPERPPVIPVFGPAAEDRLTLARAGGEVRQEQTDWGPVPQFMAAFHDERTPRVLLTEVWTSHPSARPALVEWLGQLARDGRPLVRTRAAAAAALLAAADLPSTMALLVDRWATARAVGPRVTAANTLTLAQLLGAPVVLRLLTQWCNDGQWGRRWTAIRALGLLAPLRPDLAGPALDALASRARADASNQAERDNLTESAALLLSAGQRRGEVLAEFVRLLYRDTPAVRGLALAAFARACDNAGEGALVGWYAETGMYQPDTARDMATLWRTALGDHIHTRAALQALQTWVHVATRRTDAATALELLLPALIVTADDRKRLDHELRTMRAEDGGPRPPLAERLLDVLRPAPAAH
ncbi:hypothetical protein JK359_05965 [Streptomyces actinomycinicus]|uniref:HEAT repeat domain-containing protein n=1 Tax=Streptomyces actinomycinicus TaxID=1695166 RepID=A0A937EG63_9ACTN|nr:hypothetical protein [Streptomyces actinomycinicus]MBL1081530.1 hypothetical protein [Streptomyces actinomycinicus]